MLPSLIFALSSFPSFFYNARMSDTETKYSSTVFSMIEESGFQLANIDKESLRFVDFGMGNFAQEGVALIDLLRTDLVRITLLIMLPHQTLPQHKHPPYENCVGKEETLRALSGQVKVYVEGEDTSQNILIPAGKDPYYTVRNEHVLNTGEQYTVPVDTVHWFQGGPEGAVTLAFQNRVNEDYNVFYDPASDGCPIPASNTNNE